MYKISISTDANFKRMVAKMRGLRGDLREGARRGLVRSVTHVSSQVLGSGRVPYRRGDLRRSILPFFDGLAAEEGDMEGGVGTDKVYAPIHEFGGAVVRTQAWGRKTKPYVAHYKERAYLRVPFQQAQGTIAAIFEQEMTKASEIK